MQQDAATQTFGSIENVDPLILEMLMAKRMRSVPQKLVGQLLTIWHAEYNTSLITEVADEPFAVFLERYLYPVQYCLKEVYPVDSQAYRSKNLEQKFLIKVLEDIFKIEHEAEDS